MMKANAYLINTARGPIIDEAALVQALKNKRIAGAALDVFEFEPKMVDGLKELDNAIVLPHVGSATIETRTAMANLAAGAVMDFFSGRVPVNIVNKDVLK
jgi:lactate dehydrogenase-like 2-hydroxyacid dehydrogenase